MRAKRKRLGKVSTELMTRVECAHVRLRAVVMLTVSVEDFKLMLKTAPATSAMFSQSRKPA